MRPDPAPASPPAPRLRALLQLTALDALPRTGWLQAGIQPAESIAGHSHGAALVALAIGPDVAPPLDLGRVLGLLAVHDAAEALLGDWPRTVSELLPPGAKAAAESAAADRVLAPLSVFARDLAREYAAAATREARFARLCDRLQMGVRLVAYIASGRRGLADFAATLRRLDTTEFPAAADLHRDLLTALEFA